VIYLSRAEGGTGDGTAAHVKSGWRDPAYEWIEVSAYGDRASFWIKGRWRGDDGVPQRPPHLPPGRKRVVTK